MPSREAIGGFNPYVGASLAEETTTAGLIDNKDREQPTGDGEGASQAGHAPSAPDHREENRG